LNSHLMEYGIVKSYIYFFQLVAVFKKINVFH
jgi:hypothetical protein